MGVLQDFERRLEGAVEGFFARAFGSGLQAVELAKGLRRYAMDTRNVTEQGVVVPNVYRVRISARDAERFEGLGIDLAEELATLLAESAVEEDWLLRGPVAVLLEGGDDVRVGRYEIAGRVESAPAAAPGRPRPAPTAPPAPDADPLRDDAPATEADAAPGAPGAGAPPSDGPAAPSATPRDHTMVIGADGPTDDDAGGATLRVVSGGDPRVLRLRGRTVAGRGAEVGLRLHDDTVSREHAAFVRRESTWWVVDLGSTNGTTVNGRRAAEHPLTDGDRVGLGEAVLQFVEV